MKDDVYGGIYKKAKKKNMVTISMPAEDMKKIVKPDITAEQLYNARIF